MAGNGRPGTPRGGRTKLGVGEPLTPSQEILLVPKDDLIGQVVLDRYVIETVLGAGATGTVYRGRHQALNRPVAIKVLHEDFVHHPTMVARFRREAAAAGRLHHPNLSGALDVGETGGGLPLMVMDLVEGRSLRALMDDALFYSDTALESTAADTLSSDAGNTLVGATSLTRARIIHLVRQILRGLDHAHAANLVHRDLKPDNVLVERDVHGVEVPRIVDFGIAALRDEGNAARLTETGALLGTPMYMAPEQARGERVDHRADLFALGVMMYEMLSGTTPFDGSALEVVIANMNEDAPAIAARAPHARPDPVLELFMRKLIARDPAKRFASAHDALAMLDLVERDPEDAALRLGRMDVVRALGVILISASSMLAPRR